MPSVGQLLDEHAAALRSFLRARCGDADLTQDLMQEVALRVVQAAGRLDSGRNVRGYLFRTAANVWRDFLRREYGEVARVLLQVMSNGVLVPCHKISGLL